MNSIEDIPYALNAPNRSSAIHQVKSIIEVCTNKEIAAIVISTPKMQQI